MAEGHEEQRRELLTSITETFRLLQAVLADLPIPIKVAFTGTTDPDEVDRMMERARDLLQDEPVSHGAKVHLDMAILAFVSAFDVAHIAHHREELHWRYDGTHFLLAQATANLTIVALHLDDGEES
jgi:hypothetical protein